MNSTETPIDGGTGIGVASINEGWLGGQHKAIEGWGGV